MAHTTTILIWDSPSRGRTIAKGYKTVLKQFNRTTKILQIKDFCRRFESRTEDRYIYVYDPVKARTLITRAQKRNDCVFLLDSGVHIRSPGREEFITTSQRFASLTMTSAERSFPWPTLTSVSDWRNSLQQLLMITKPQPKT